MRLESIEQTLGNGSFYCPDVLFILDTTISAQSTSQGSVSADNKWTEMQASAVKMNSHVSPA